MINGKLCYFDYPIVTCWASDIVKIVSQLIDDWYSVVNRRTFYDGRLNNYYWVDFNCHIWLETVEEMEMREIESLRWDNIRKVNF